MNNWLALIFAASPSGKCADVSDCRLATAQAAINKRRCSEVRVAIDDNCTTRGSW